MNTYDLSTKTVDDLITIIEQPDDYVEEFLVLAQTELKNRNHPEKELNSKAEELYRSRCKELFSGGLFRYEEYDIPKSFILSDKMIRKIFRAELKAFIRRRKMMNDRLDEYGTSGI